MKTMTIVAGAILGMANLLMAQSYRAVDGGFEIADGKAKRCRFLYGWHGNDDPRHCTRYVMLTGDRPEVELGRYPGNIQPVKMRLGTLRFGDGNERTVFRYVRGRAEYDLDGKGSVRMVRAAASDDLIVETSAGIAPTYDGNWRLRARGERNGRTYYAFAQKECADPVPADLAAAFAAGVAERERISRAIEVRTPDPRLDSLVACQTVTADGLFEGPTVTHAAMNWHMPCAGWQTAYIALSLGRDEQFKSNARLYFTEGQKADGRIRCMIWEDDIYNMSEVLVDAVLRYWIRTGDDAFMRECAYAGIKRHLDWMERTLKDPTTGLFENWLNAYNTDNKWTNGGAGTVASAYGHFAYRTLSKVADRLGLKDDARRFRARADEILALVDRWLWSETKGVWGEYRERFGLRRLIDCPDTSSVYTAIDSGLAEAHPERAASSLAWIERNVPSLFAPDGTTLLYSSSKPPVFWSTCHRHPQETIPLALAYWQTGEPEMGWRHLLGSVRSAWNGTSAGPGVLGILLSEKAENAGDIDYGGSVGVFLRATVEGLFGISVDGTARSVRIRPGFPASWTEASIRTPYFSYSWTRAGGVKVTGNPQGLTVRVDEPRPRLVGAALPKPHRRFGEPAGAGTEYSVSPDATFDYVDIGGVCNRNLRTLHAGTYGPRIADFTWNSWTPSRTIMQNGRTWWEATDSEDYTKIVRQGRNVPDRLSWPADGILRTPSGLQFRLSPAEATNAAFVAFYEPLPESVTLPLSGKAEKLALLVAVSTNPNLSWTEAARIVVDYADGPTAELPLVPPDNCDDWLNYLQASPYHLTGEHVTFDVRAHANVLAIPLDASRELRRMTLSCRSTETFAGVLAATLVRRPAE